jgi:hypothetical protein
MTVAQMIVWFSELRCPTAKLSIELLDGNRLSILGVIGGLAGVILEAGESDGYLPEDIKDRFEELEAKGRELDALCSWANEALETLRDHSARYGWAEDLIRNHPDNEDGDE